jgi:hypothetical protein
VAAKVKSPFELAVSAVRASGAHIENPRPIASWVSRMGQPLYSYQAPTGYPDRADSWVNTGSLLNRMNFGLQLAAQRIAGVEIDLPGLHDGREPESREEALSIYAALLLPGRDLGTTLKLLTPMLADPVLVHRVDAAAPAAEPAAWMEEGRPSRRRQHAPTPLEQVVGLILGSPEFQRR